MVVAAAVSSTETASTLQGDDLGLQREVPAPAAPSIYPRLPAAEFSYIGRPPETFEGRWTAIEEALLARFSSNDLFSLVDVGSNHGYFALNTALRFPAAHVIGVEGSVGVGNGILGTTTRSSGNLMATGAVRTHLAWVEKLGVSNCHVAPEVWDLDHIEKLIQAGMRADVMLELSVVHHIDGICGEAYKRRGLSQVDGSLSLLASMLRLACVHILELPDKPWLDHLHNTFGTARGIIGAAIALSGEEWTMRQIYRNDWLGSRELWLLETCRVRDTRSPTLRPYFQVLLPGDEALAVADYSDMAQPAENVLNADWLNKLTVPGDEDFAARSIAGRWRNAYGASIQVLGSAPLLQCQYSGEDATRRIEWEEGCHWALKSASGSFALCSFSNTRLVWREKCRGWETEWIREL